MRVPEDYIMGTRNRKSSGIGCFFFLILAVIGIVIIICAVNYSATSTPLSKWLNKTWEDLRITLIGFGVAIGITIVALIVGFLVQRTSSSTGKDVKITTSVSQMSPIQYEEYIARYILSKGFAKVRTTKATGDFGADVLCEDAQGHKICIQCKHYSQSVGIEAVQQVIAAKEYYKCDEAWVCASNAYTPAAHELARKTGVKLYTIK